MSARLRDDNVNCLPPIRTSTQGGVPAHDKDIGKRARRTLRAQSGRETRTEWASEGQMEREEGKAITEREYEVHQHRQKQSGV